MTLLSTRLRQYLDLRRKLGFKLIHAGGLLRHFVRFAKEKGASFITTKLALQWATQPADGQPAQWANRLGMVRRFAHYLSGVDSRTEIPPLRLLPHRYRRKAPYLYRQDEVRRLIESARELPSPKGLRGITCSTCFGLLAVSGMRVGEALGLDRQDVDLTDGLITLRRAKGNKSRLIPLHPSTQNALRRYERRRNRICPKASSSSFFVSERGTRLTEWALRYWFIRVSRQIGLRQPSDSHGPRLHDLRHRFAIGTLLKWYRTNQDVEVHLPELTTYLGHAHVSDTYWYLTATPELLRLATRRWERAQGGRS